MDLSIRKINLFHCIHSFCNLRIIILNSMSRHLSQPLSISYKYVIEYHTKELLTSLAKHDICSTLQNDTFYFLQYLTSNLLW